MIHVRPLDARDRAELQRLARREVGRVSERIRMILLSSKGYTVAQIADIFECDPASVRSWIARFDADGVRGLYDRPRSGRPRQAGAVAQQTIRQILPSPPAAHGYDFGFWTVGTLCAHAGARARRRVSGATMRRALWAGGYRWRRPRHCLPTDPAARTKMWDLCGQLLGAPAEAAILCADECDVHLLPGLRAMWMRRGEQAQVPTPGQNRKRSVFGALEWATGQWVYAVEEHKRAVEFLAFLSRLSTVYPQRPIWVVLDNASIHKSKAVSAWLAAHPVVRLLYLPTYAGHRENPVEKVWWRLKGQIVTNRLYSDMDALVNSVHSFFASWTRQAAQQLGVAA
jgi:transposase